MDKEHRMFLLSADLRKVYARLAKKFNAGIVQRQEHAARTRETGVEIPFSAPEKESE